MSIWNFGTSDASLVMNINAADDTGLITPTGPLLSTIWSRGVAYPVAGEWIGSGFDNATISAFSLYGNTRPALAPQFLAASGNVQFTEQAGWTALSIVVAQALSAPAKSNQSPTQYQGELSPNGAWTVSPGPWAIADGDQAFGSLMLTLVTNGTVPNQLSAAATWTPNGAPSAITVGVSWIKGELAWFAGGTQYQSGKAKGSGFEGSYSGGILRKNGTWTASQSK